MFFLIKIVQRDATKSARYSANTRFYLKIMQGANLLKMKLHIADIPQIC
jgi:hypothetical protein